MLLGFKDRKNLPIQILNFTLLICLFICVLQIEEWYGRAKKMDEMSEQVNELFQRLTFSANRELVHDLYPYVWDVRCIVSLLNFYVKWLCKYFIIRGG